MDEELEQSKEKLEIMEYKDTGTMVGFGWVPVGIIDTEEEFEIFLKTKEATGQKKSNFRIRPYKVKVDKPFLYIKNAGEFKNFPLGK